VYGLKYQRLKHGLECEYDQKLYSMDWDWKKKNTELSDDEISDHEIESMDQRIVFLPYPEDLENII
jgi:hypothetical protein